jgi:osmotically-inducible protein OsmY
MANQQGNGRRVAMPDDHQPSWRPQDEGDRRMRPGDDDERDWDRQRSTESYGQGQSGYGAGRYGEDRSFGSRNQSAQNMSRDRGTDERFAGGRGGEAWSPQDRGYSEQSGYGQRGYGDDDRERGTRSRRGNAGERDMRARDRDDGRYGDDDERGGMMGSRGHYGSRGMSGRGGWGNERNYSEGSYGGEQGPGLYSNQGTGGFGAQGQGGFGQHLDRGQSYYGQQGYGGGNYLGQGGQQMGDQQSQRAGGHGAQGQGGMYGQGGYNEGMYGDRDSMQHRYGSQGYQGWGQDEHGQQTYGHGGRAGQQGVHQGVHGVQGRSGGHRGKGPAGYQRSDDRIRELVCEALTDHDHIDATRIEISVKNGEVTLTGTVEDRRQKRLAEDIVEDLGFVKDVLNQLRVGSADKRQDTRGSHDGKNGTSKDLSSTKDESERRHKA